MYLSRFEIENHRCFKARQVLDFTGGTGTPKQWTVLLGNNGTGKTTVLREVGILLHYARISESKHWREFLALAHLDIPAAAEARAYIAMAVTDDVEYAAMARGFLGSADTGDRTQPGP